MPRRFARAAVALLAPAFLAAPAHAGDPTWPDPVARHVRPARTLGLTHGPILGRPAATSMRVWVRTAKPTTFHVVFSTRLPLQPDLPPTRAKLPTDDETRAAPGQTLAKTDNTAAVDLTDLTPDTRYYYGIWIDGQLADTRMDLTQPWPSFRTLPAAATYRDAKTNPKGRFNLCFATGCGGCQDPIRSGGQYVNAPSFGTILRRHGRELDFFYMNGDYTYEELRDGTLAGVRANYKLYMDRGRNMANLQRYVPWLFMYDDHEVHDNLFGAGEVGYRGSRHGRELRRDEELRAWLEYAGWANYPAPQRGALRFGQATVKKGSDILHDPQADFSALKAEQVSTILVGKAAKANAGTFGLVKVLDPHRLQVTPAFRTDGEVRYTIGTHQYFDWKLGNCHFFALDTRGERSRFSQKDIRSPKQFLLGKTQREWLLRKAAASDADLLFLFSSTGCVIPHSAYHVNPSRGTVSKGDGFPGYVHEREIILKALDKLAKPVLIFTGDVHNSACVQITDNVWEMMVGPLNSNAHPIGTCGNMPYGGWYTNEGRRVKVKWIAGFPNTVHYSRLHTTHYAVVQVNNMYRTAKPEGVGYQYVAYDAPQVVVRFHDGHTGRLKYAEGISTLDVGGKREKKQKEEIEKKKRVDVPSTAKRVEGGVGGREGAAR